MKKTILLALLTFAFQIVFSQGAKSKHPFIRNPEKKKDILVDEGLLIDSFCKWKSKYLFHEGDQAYINNDEMKDDSGKTTSEAIGYGMLIEVYMSGIDDSAQAHFNALYRYAQMHPANPIGRDDKLSQYLMAWKQYHKGSKTPDETDSAVDGDLDIAYALLMAQEQWGSDIDTVYRHAARQHVQAIKALEMDVTNYRILKGNTNGHGTDSLSRSSIRLSDFMPDHFRAFYALTGDVFWAKLVTVNYRRYCMAQQQFSPEFGLFPEYMLVSAKEKLTLVPKNIGKKSAKEEDFGDGGDEKHPNKFGWMYGFNSCRVPWRLITDRQLNQTETDTGLLILQRLNAGMRKYANNDPCMLTNVIPLKNDRSASKHAKAILKAAKEATADINVIAPICAALTVETASGWQDTLQHRMIDDPKYHCDATDPDQIPDRHYYENTLRILCMLTITHHLWQPPVRNVAY